MIRGKLRRTADSYSDVLAIFAHSGGMDGTRIDATESFLRFRRTGDPRAFEAMVRSVNPTLSRLAVGLVKDPAVAEDVLQSTFVIAIEKAASFDASKSLLPWLIGILSREARGARTSGVRPLDPSRLDVPRSRDPEELMTEQEFRLAVEAAVEALRKPYGEVVRLYLLQELRPYEIADRLSCSSSTVRSRLARGMELIRPRLARYVRSYGRSFGEAGVMDGDRRRDVG